MKETKEWGMVEDLMQCPDMTFNQMDFISELHDKLDPHLPFLEQRSKKQLNYLEILYFKYIVSEDELTDEHLKSLDDLGENNVL